MRMQAVWYERAGAATEVLQLGEMPCPDPEAGEVRVRIAWSAVNPFDVKKREQGRDLANWPRIVPHTDGSGTIDKVGDGVAPERVGERVWLFGAQVGQAFGSCAGYCVVPSWKAVALPAAVSLRHGACIGIPLVTALEALSSSGPLDGKNVLVAGGAGRVGAYAVQIAAARGARVIATASSGKCTEVEALGAKTCMDYRDPAKISRLRDLAGKTGFDLIVEPRFATNLATNVQVVARNGVITAYGVDDNPEPVVPVTHLVMKNVTCRFVGIFGLDRVRQFERLEQVSALLVGGQLRHRVGVVAPLSQTGALHAQLQSTGVSGAALIEID
jgi:NADPH2:quinone reductase